MVVLFSTYREHFLRQTPRNIYIKYCRLKHYDEVDEALFVPILQCSTSKRRKRVFLVLKFRSPPVLSRKLGFVGVHEGNNISLKAFHRSVVSGTRRLSVSSLIVHICKHVTNDKFSKIFLRFVLNRQIRDFGCIESKLNSLFLPRLQYHSSLREKSERVLAMAYADFLL